MSTMWLPVAQEQRVDVLGELGVKTREVWIALHGYGQLVAYFQRHFRACVTEQRAFVFPQGQHKFYLNGVSGRVGASWMTKDEREKDIENQRRYLSEVMRFVRKQCPNARFHLVGFSQGVATGMRFLGYSPEAFTSVLAWAGSWPPDLDAKGLNALREVQFQGWFGDNDPFIGAEKQREILEWYRSEYEWVPEVGYYEGGHAFDKAILKSEIERLERL